MRGSSLESRFLAKLGDSWEEATPGFCLQAYQGGRKVADLEVGQTYRYYDLASLTKIIFSASAYMMAVEDGLIGVTDRVSKWVDWFPAGTPHRLKDLFTHSAGLTWWYPFYKEVSRRAPGASPAVAWGVFEKILRRKILADFDPKTVLSKQKSLYSDLDLFLLGLALGQATGSGLYDIWSRLNDRMDLSSTDFHRGNKPLHARKLYAPTETDKWRGKTLQGEVHDENTWALGGVAPHAGLFGPIEDLSRFGLLVRKGMRGEKSRSYFSPSTVQTFTHRSIPRARGDWALGFMMPTKGGASCGPEFSLSSVGHTGFTGTSLWYDPKRDLLVTILSNRVHPTRENKNFVTLRPQLHTWIAEEL